jgi:ADP-ribose pyrophosphatase YjhB (NUDIX family)
MHQPVRVRVCGLVRWEDSVLLCGQAKHGRHYWLLPGGGVEPGESLETALRRELREECGIETAVVSGPIAIAESIAPPGDPSGKHVVHVLFAVEVDESLEHVHSEDAAIRNLRLVPRDEIPDVDLRPPIHRFVARFEPGDPFVSLGPVWVK